MERNQRAQENAISIESIILREIEAVKRNRFMSESEKKNKVRELNELKGKKHE